MRKIKLSKGYVALIDNEDYERVNKHKWCYSLGGNKVSYCAITFINKKNTRLHRFILNITDSKLIVDHINGDPLDNRKTNLRLCTNAENRRNTKKPKNGTSKYKGVYSFTKGWKARICLNYKIIQLGSFINEKEAAKAYNEAAKKYHGEFARLNIIEGEE